MDTLRVGVIGLRFGRQHVRTLANMEGVKLVAVADRGGEWEQAPGSLEAYARHYGASAYRDGIAMMDGEELDAVSLCTSPRTRAPLIEHAARQGIALFVEKPWATDLAHAQELARLCRQHQAFVMTAFSFRYHPAIVRLRELMAGELGPGWLLNGEYVFGWRPPDDAWLWDPANGNGFFNENSCHLFDAVCSLLGDPVSVTAQAINPLGTPSEHAAAVTLRFAQGAVAALTIGGIATRAFRRFPRIDVVTANGQAHLFGREHVWDGLRWATRDADDAHELLRPPEALGSTRYTHAWQHFVECVRTGRQPETGVEAGVRAVAVAMGVYESARGGQPVSIRW